MPDVDENPKHFLYPNECEQIGYVQLLDMMGDEFRIVDAARQTFGKQSDHKKLTPSDKAILKHIYQNREKPLEHVMFTFKFCVPLFVERHHRTYRMWKVSEKSMRWVKGNKDNLKFYVPKTFRMTDGSEQDPKIYGYIEAMADEPLSDCLNIHCENCLALYEAMLFKGIVKEQARMVLPQNMYVEYIGTIDLKNLLHFIDERIVQRTQYETRVLAQYFDQLVRRLFPNLFQ